MRMKKTSTIAPDHGSEEVNGGNMSQSWPLNRPAVGGKDGARAAAVAASYFEVDMAFFCTVGF